jgi:hypothetical protein
MSGNCNLNKVKAYKKVAKNYYAAVGILNEKKLAFGEPAVVPFYYPDESDLDRKIKLAVGYGSINGGVEVLSNIHNDSSTRIDDATVAINKDGEKQVVTVSEAFDYVIGKINEFDYDNIDDDVIIDIINGSFEQNIE